MWTSLETRFHVVHFDVDFLGRSPAGPRKQILHSPWFESFYFMYISFVFNLLDQVILLCWSIVVVVARPQPIFESCCDLPNVCLSDASKAVEDDLGARQTGRGTGVGDQNGLVYVKWVRRHVTHPTPWLALNRAYFRWTIENTPWPRVIGNEIRTIQPCHHTCQPFLPTEIELIDVFSSIHVHIGF